MIQELTVDLRRPAAARWHLTPGQRDQARELFIPYKADLGLRPDVSEFLVSTARDLVREECVRAKESLTPGSRRFLVDLSAIDKEPLVLPVDEVWEACVPLVALVDGVLQSVLKHFW